MRRSTAMVVTGIAGVLAGVVLVAVVLLLLGSGDVKSRLGDATYDMGDAARIARRADEQPVLLPVLVGFERDILVSHLGGSEWRAFLANPPGEDRRCQVRWRKRTRDFRAPCTGVIYPPDGTGLTQYSATVDERGHLVLDLRTAVTTTAS